MVSRDDMSSALPRPRSPSIARTSPRAALAGSGVRNSTFAGFTSRCSTPVVVQRLEAEPDLADHLRAPARP